MVENPYPLWSSAFEFEYNDWIPTQNYPQAKVLKTFAWG